MSWLLSLAARFIPVGIGLNPTFILAAVVALFTLLGSTYIIGRSDGKAVCVASSYSITLEKNNAASHADDAARRCAADPACRLSNDGYKRD